MTTAEFIKMLQEADPKGTAHIRMEGGVPHAAILKPGYYDGPYSYIDEDFNWVKSASGSKVDIHCIDVWDFVDRVKGKSRSFDEIKHKFKFELGTYVYPEQIKEREDALLEEAEKAFNDMLDIEDGMLQRQLEEVIEKYNDGWRFYQNKEVDQVPEDEMNYHVYYTWKIVNPEGIVESNGSTPYLTEPILESSQWTKHDNGVILGYYEWIYTPDNV